MKKWFALSSQIALLAGAVSISAVSAASCSVEVWKTNIQMVVSPGGSKLADHSFQQNTFSGILRFLREVRYRGEKFVEPKPEKSIDKLGGIWRKPVGFDAMRFIETYRDAHASGAAALICTGFEQAKPLGELTSRNKDEFKKFPSWVPKVRNDTGIVYVDGFLNGDESNPYNISTVSYAADQAGIMAGVLTGIMVNIDDYYQPHDIDFSSANYKNIQTAQYDDKGKIVTKDKKVQTKTVTPDAKTSGWYKGMAFKIGGYVGLPGQATLTFLNGYFHGARFFNEHIDEVKTITQQQIGDLYQKEWYPLTVVGAASDSCVNLNMDGFSAGSFSPVSEPAKQLANSYMDRKIAAFLPVAGPQDALVVREIVTKKQPIAVIGTDVALEDDDSVNQYVLSPKGGDQNFKRSIIPFSIMKNLGDSVFSILSAVNKCMINNTTTEQINDYYGFGYNNFGVLKNNGVTVSHGKIYYDNKPGQKSVDKATSEVLSTKLVKALKDAMDQRTEWQVKIPKGDKTQSVPFYESLNGHEFETTWVSNYKGKSFISIPRISDSHNDVDGDNVYDPLPPKAQLIADPSDVATFVQNLYKYIGKPTEKTSAQVNWYMYR